MLNDNGQNPLPGMRMPDAFEIIRQRQEAAKMPPYIYNEYRTVDFAIGIDGTIARLMFWTPPLPFIKHAIPFDISSLKNLERMIYDAIRELENNLGVHNGNAA